MNCPTVALLACGLLAGSAAGKELRAFRAFDIGFPKTGTQDANPAYRRIPQAGSFTWRELLQKLETQNKKEDQISIRTTPDNAESGMLHTTGVIL